MKKRIVTAVICLFCIIISAGVYYIFNSKPETEYTIERQVRYGFTVQNKTNRAIKNAEFLVYGPVKQTASQLCKSLTSSHPYDLKTDKSGNQILRFRFDVLPPYASKIIKIKADMLFAEVPNKTDVDSEMYLKPQLFVESDHPEIIAEAKKLEKNNILLTTENINAWVAGYIDYAGYISRERGALYALTHRKGDCTEYMDLFVALCRSLKIQARGIGGYICTKNTILKPVDYHNWSEFYHKGRWQIADTQNKKFMEQQSHYLAMKIIAPENDTNKKSFNRYKINNDDLKVKMN